MEATASRSAASACGTGETTAAVYAASRAAVRSLPPCRRTDGISASSTQRALAAWTTGSDARPQRLCAIYDVTDVAAGQSV